MVRVFGIVFWVAASLFVVSLALSDFNVVLFGDRGLRVINAALLVVVVVCSGVIASHEFWLNPMDETERGEWTNRQLFFAIIFATSLFIAAFFVPAALF